MARPPPTRWLTQLTVLVLLSGCAGAQQVGPTVESVMRARKPLPPAVVATAPVTPPTAPVMAQAATPKPQPPPAIEQKPWVVRTWRGAEFIDVREIAKRHGLKLETSSNGATATLTERGTERLRFDEKQRDFYFDGLRVFLGEAVIREDDSLWVSRLDVLKIVAPLLRPADHVASLPSAPPKLIVLDPGHGGTDPGKENKLVKVNEKTLTLDVALRLKKLLETDGWRVLLTRTTDTQLAADKVTDLQRRADFANQHKAELFVSIHFNAVERDPQRVTGVETYTLAPRSILSTAAEKKDELTDVAFPGNRLDFGNLLLAEHLHRSMISSLKVPDRGLKLARFSVLRFVQCPGILVECAYLSNEAEARRAATPEYRQQIALALAKGLQEYAQDIQQWRPKPADEAAASAPARP